MKNTVRCDAPNIKRAVSVPEYDTLINILRASAQCRCDFDCYCDKNANWAEDMLQKHYPRRLK